MKKSEIIILGLIAVAIVIAGLAISWRVYFDYKNQELTIDLSGYYESLYSACSEKYSEDATLEGCCFLSVDVMTYDDYTLADANKNCAEGYQPQAIGCESSYTWCSKISEIKE